MVRLLGLTQLRRVLKTCFLALPFILSLVIIRFTIMRHLSKPRVHKHLESKRSSDILPETKNFLLPTFRPRSIEAHRPLIVESFELRPHMSVDDAPVQTHVTPVLIHQERQERHERQQHVTFASRPKVDEDEEEREDDGLLPVHKSLKGHPTVQEFDNITILRTPKRACNSKLLAAFLVIFVLSPPNGTDMRDAIRQTWGNYSISVQVFFVVGQSLNSKRNLDREWLRFGDLLLLNLNDSYHRLTYKVLAALSWISQTCTPMNYILKSDDDMVINIPYLMRMLRRLQGEPDRSGPKIIGNIIKQNWVQRSPTNKWYVPWKDYRLPYFPKHASGNAYILNGDAVWGLLRAMEIYRRNSDPILPIEDAFVTGILAQMVKVPHCPLPGFTGWFTPPMTICDYVLHHTFTGTHMNSTTLRIFWTAAQQTKVSGECPSDNKPNKLFLRRWICPHKNW